MHTRQIIVILLLTITSVRAQLRPTGSFRILPGVIPVPAPFATAQKFQVDLPDVPHTPGGGTGILYLASPTDPTKGWVIHFAGHNGSGRFAAGAAAQRDAYYRSLLAQGYGIAEADWLGGGWIFTAPHRLDGMATLAGRPATLIMMGPFGGLPLQAVGVSGGACQLGYALAFYAGVADRLKAAFPMSSMPFDEQTRGCTGDYDYSERGFIATAEGNASTKSVDPCVLGDATWSAFWDANSVTGGALYNYPTCRVVMIEGLRDSPDILSRAAHYQGVLVSAGQPVERYNYNGGHVPNAEAFGILLQRVTEIPSSTTKRKVN